MDFDALRAAVVPGAGVVGRWPGIVCVAECADRQVLRQLIDVCATASGTEPGRVLARRLAMWLGGADAPGEGLRFGTVAVTGGDPRSGGGQRGEQWAVFLYGSVGLVVPDRQVALSGAQSVAWTDRLIPRPDAPVVLALEGGPIPPGLVDGVHDLRGGIVPGAGAVLVPSGDHGSADRGEEAARGRRPDPRWSDVADTPERQWDADPAPAAPADLYPGDGSGNGVSSRGLGPLEDYHPGDTGPGRSSGRAHLRPVPSGSNGIAHRGWVPRRGSVDDLDRVSGPDAEQPARPAEPEPADTHQPERPEELREPEPSERGYTDDHPGNGTANGTGNGLPGGSSNGVANGARDDAADDAVNGTVNGAGNGTMNGAGGGTVNGGAGNGTVNGGAANGTVNGAADGQLNGAANGAANGSVNGSVNGASYDLLGAPDAPAQDVDRSPWSDDRGHDAGRPDRIEGWFATGTDGGTESGMSAIGPSERRRRRHRLPDDDPSGAPAPVEHDEVDDERGSDDFGAASFGHDTGTSAVEETRISGPVLEPVPALPDGDGDDDGAGDGTPRLGVPTQETAPPDEPVHPLAEPDQDAPRTTALRSERILGAAPDEQDHESLDDGAPTGGLAVEDAAEEPAPRPPVGLLVFDDGATYTVDAEYLMGRMPEADPRVASGALRSLALEDSSGAVSRVHAQIVVNGWEALLVDVGSRNGTFVSPPGEQGWTQLPAGETHLLVPGTRVRIGGRSFQFEAPNGAR